MRIWVTNRGRNLPKVTQVKSGGAGGIYWRGPLQYLPTWLPLARICIYLPFLALKSALPSHAAGWKCWGMSASCPQWSIGLIPHSSLAAYSSLFHFPAPRHYFLRPALKSATHTRVLVFKWASGGNQARTIVFSQRSWQLGVLGVFMMSRFQLRRTYIRILYQLSICFLVYHSS